VGAPAARDRAARRRRRAAAADAVTAADRAVRAGPGRLFRAPGAGARPAAARRPGGGVPVGGAGRRAGPGRRRPVLHAVPRPAGGRASGRRPALPTGRRCGWRRPRPARTGAFAESATLAGRYRTAATHLPVAAAHPPDGGGAAARVRGRAGLARRRCGPGWHRCVAGVAVACTSPGHRRRPAPDGGVLAAGWACRLRVRRTAGWRRRGGGTCARGEGTRREPRGRCDRVAGAARGGRAVRVRAARAALAGRGVGAGVLRDRADDCPSASWSSTLPRRRPRGAAGRGFRRGSWKVRARFRAQIYPRSREPGATRA
jgi:hypothetical protein